MKSEILFRIVADLILITHIFFVAFIILGLLLIIIGGFFGWSQVRNPWFRLLHLAAIAYVVLQSWFGKMCPLTILEMNMRERAGDAVYPGSFIAHWLNELLYYRAPAWLFIVSYTAFGALVVIAWFRIHPRPFSVHVKC
ncbi:MAG: DUF2784 domain-containing protein [Spirochaetes bacterium]|nr:DUF2784 domain-containing protein [Spirochaetota bacterium]